jgi:hypothetical protein
MENTEIILWAMTGGFTINFALMKIMFNKIDERFEKVDQRFEKVDQRFDKVDQRFDKLEEKVNDLDRRMCRMEGAFSSKEFCVLRNDSQSRKVE